MIYDLFPLLACRRVLSRNPLARVRVRASFEYSQTISVHIGVIKDVDSSDAYRDSIRRDLSQGLPRFIAIRRKMPVKGSSEYLEQRYRAVHRTITLILRDKVGRTEEGKRPMDRR